MVLEVLFEYRASAQRWLVFARVVGVCKSERGERRLLLSGPIFLPVLRLRLCVCACVCMCACVCV